MQDKIKHISCIGNVKHLIGGVEEQQVIFKLTRIVSFSLLLLKGSG